MSTPKFVCVCVQSSKDLQHYFRLVAANGETTLHSEAYTTRQSRDNGIEAVRRNAPFDQRYERTHNNNNYTFNLKAENGEIIGSSESYTSAYGHEIGIESVKRDAPIAIIIDRL